MNVLYETTTPQFSTMGVVAYSKNNLATLTGPVTTFSRWFTASQTDTYGRVAYYLQNNIGGGVLFIAHIVPFVF